MAPITRAVLAAATALSAPEAFARLEPCREGMVFSLVVPGRVENVKTALYCPNFRRFVPIIVPMAMNHFCAYYQ